VMGVTEGIDDVYYISFVKVGHYNVCFHLRKFVDRHSAWKSKTGFAIRGII
jgi:hypothetical protein